MVMHRTACPHEWSGRLEARLRSLRLPCNLLLEFATAGAGGKPVRLCDFGSAGMTGRFFTSWLTLDYGKRAPTAPFSQAAPTRTFVLAEHC